MNIKYKISIIIVALFLSLTYSFCTEPSMPYAVSNIPKHLLLNANAVVRVDEKVQTIEDVDHSTVKLKYAITLLNDKASRHRYAVIPYNKFVKVSGIKAYVYDSEGNLVTSVIPEIRDMSGNYGELASDDRLWLISFPVRKYPYTIEYEYVENESSPYNYGSKYFRSQHDVAVERSGMQLQVKKGLNIRVNESELINKCDTAETENKFIYSWQEENLQAIKTEELLLFSFKSPKPLVETAPTNFTLGGINGNMITWETTGRFYYDLNKNRDNLTPEFQAKLKETVVNISDQKERVRKLYEYLQKNTRYVSIQLGIGGFQTLEATFVEKKGYGDCKALTNYMKAMLKSVGIKSYQALINTDEEIKVNFPSNQFDHVILCIPLQKDTIWLECTSQTIPFNYLGGDDGNKHVLLLTENGGKLVKTPDYLAGKNEKNSTFGVNIDIMGNATIKGRQTYNGVTYEEPYETFKSGKTEREEFINNLIAAKNLKIYNISYPTEAPKTPTFYMDCDLLAKNFVTKTSKRMIFNPKLFDATTYIPKYDSADFKVIFNHTYNDTIVYSYPFGYKTEFIPEPVKIESKFGNFLWNCQLIKDKLIVTSKLEVYKNEYTKNDLADITEFINKIAGIDRRLILLIKE